MNITPPATIQANETDVVNTVVICGLYLSMNERCEFEETDERHGRCYRHMTCVVFDKDDDLKRANFAPSRCQVCQVVINSLNEAVRANNDTSVADIKAGSRYLDRLVLDLGDIFNVVNWEDPILPQWVFSLRSGKRLTYDSYLTNSRVKIHDTVQTDEIRSAKVVAINLMQELGWIWIDNINVTWVSTPSGVQGIKDKVYDSTFFPPTYLYKKSQDAEFYKLVDPSTAMSKCPS